jgi:transcription initiation factor TFIID subunit 7
MKGLEDDVKMKADARQVLIDEIEEAEAEKRGPMSADRAGTIDVDDVGTRAGTPAFTPGITPAGIKSSGVNTDVEMDEDDDDDLFGDATGDEADGESAAGTPMLGGEQTDAEGEDDNEPTDGAGGDHGVNAQPDEDDEMAMMLQMELEAGGLNEDDAPPPPSSQAGTPGAFDLAGVDEQTQADATAALESFAMTGGMEADGAGMMGAGGAGGFGSVAFGAVEGGVGMRRLASGARADDDSSDDDSDD